MVKIVFRKLIQAAPFEEKTKKKILAQEAGLTDDQKYELRKSAWELLAKEYKNKLKYKIDSALLEMAQNKKDYSKSDFAEIQAELYMDFAKRLETTGAEEEIKSVRSKLQQFFKRPLPPITTS